MCFSTHRQVNFIICGTQKGGTTALDAYLREHPEVCMADEKEVHFFDNEKYFSARKPNYSLYHSFFRPKKNHKIVGEATPVYMYWESSPERIFNYNPKVKLIVLLRNPIERAYSQWNMQRSRGVEKLSFIDAVKSEKERCGKAMPLQHRNYSYVDRGYYLEQLRRLWKYFPKENLLILKNEDLKNQPSITLNKVYKFLNVEQIADIEEKDVHSRPYKSKMTQEERSYLIGLYREEIEELEKELGWDCSDWKN